MDFSKALAIMDGSMNDVLMIGLKIILMITASLLLWFLFAAVAGVVFTKKYINKSMFSDLLPTADKKPVATAAQYNKSITKSPTNRPPSHPNAAPAIKGKDSQESHAYADPALTTAVKTGNWATAYQLLKSGTSPHGVDRSGRTLLDIAIKNKDKHIIQLLHSHGVESRSPVR